MNKYILIILAFPVIFCFAQENKKVEIHKHLVTKHQYLKAYADKDSTLPYIINLWFEERKSAKQKFIALPITILVTGASSYVVKNGNRENSSIASYGAIFGGISFLFSIPISLKGVKKLRMYSLKHLNQNLDLILNKQQKGNKILENLLRERMIEGY